MENMRDTLNLDDVLVTSEYSDMMKSSLTMLELLENDMRYVQAANSMECREKLDEMAAHHERVAKIRTEMALAERNFEKLMRKKYAELNETYHFLGGK